MNHLSLMRETVRVADAFPGGVYTGKDGQVKGIHRSLDGRTFGLSTGHEFDYEKHYYCCEYVSQFYWCKADWIMTSAHGIFTAAGSRLDHIPREYKHFGGEWRRSQFGGHFSLLPARRLGVYGFQIPGKTNPETEFLMPLRESGWYCIEGQRAAWWNGEVWTTGPDGKHVSTHHPGVDCQRLIPEVLQNATPVRF